MSLFWETSSHVEGRIQNPQLLLFHYRNITSSSPSPLSGYVYTHTQTHIYLYILNLDIILYLNHLRVSCKVMVPLPLEGDATVFSQSKDILLHNDPN